MKKTFKKVAIPALAILALLSVSTTATARGDRGTIVSIHTEKGTAKYQAALGLPPGQKAGGRYAVVRIDNGAYGDASFALVYVPPKFKVRENSVVLLNAKGVTVLAKPGSAAVSKIINSGSAFVST